MNVKERFLNYVVIDSGSSETSGTHPSTEKQWDMARLLETELKEMGAENVRISPTCYVYAEIPANVPDQPAIGLIAHMDTAPRRAHRPGASPLPGVCRRRAGRGQRCGHEAGRI